MHYLLAISYIIRAIGTMIYTITGRGIAITVAVGAMIVNVGTIAFIFYGGWDE